MSIALIDYGAGNLRSVANALAAAGARDVAIVRDGAGVRHADRVVLPGVGAFGASMAALRALPGVVGSLDERVVRGGIPFLGICVGMQLMADAGEELGRHDGLGWIGGTVRRLDGGGGVRVPHMGWNDVTTTRAGLVADGEAYFLHSYAFDVDVPADRIAATDHGGPVTAAIARDNLIGVQFHPEKSQGYGLAFLARFLKWRP